MPTECNIWPVSASRARNLKRSEASAPHTMIANTSRNDKGSELGVSGAIVIVEGRGGGRERQGREDNEGGRERDGGCDGEREERGREGDGHGEGGEAMLGFLAEEGAEKEEGEG